jgi:membrane protein implicated in regulation of membrane protease activity
MKKTAKLALLSLGSLLACLFFLSWAMQTVWIASFPGQGTVRSGLHFYLQFGAALFFLVLSVYFGWKWLRNR